MKPRTTPVLWQPPLMAPGDPERILRIVQRLRPAPVATQRHDGQHAQQDCVQGSQSK